MQKESEIRVFIEGVFDVMHFGHMNAFRQGKLLGNYLVVGVNTDESVERCKGTRPIMTEAERISAIRSCRWVDEVVEDWPYVMTPKDVSWVVKKHKIDYIIHGDDPCLHNGNDVYKEAKERGIFKSISRTEGVSTTDVVGRILSDSLDHHESSPNYPMGGILASRMSRVISSNSVGIEPKKTVKL